MVQSCKLGYLGNHMTDWAEILCVLTKRQNLSAHKISAQSVQWFPRYPSLQDRTIYRISLQDRLNYIRRKHIILLLLLEEECFFRAALQTTRSRFIGISVFNVEFVIDGTICRSINLRLNSFMRI